MTEGSENTFWLVWNPAGGAPTFQHNTEESARTEASRLARSNPGLKFYVLASTGCAVKRDVDWIECEINYCDHVPF